MPDYGDSESHNRFRAMVREVVDAFGDSDLEVKDHAQGVSVYYGPLLLMEANFRKKYASIHISNMIRDDADAPCPRCQRPHGHECAVVRMDLSPEDQNQQYNSFARHLFRLLGNLNKP